MFSREKLQKSNAIWLVEFRDAHRLGEDLSANNREFMVLEGSEGRKIISNKNELKQFKNGKQLTLETATNSRR